jgi:hypothetical protein
MHATPYLYRNNSMVELTYTMPAGKVILFSILSWECKYGTEKSDAEVCKCATEDNEFGVIFAIIDRIRLQNLEQYRIQFDFFNIILPEDNIYWQTLAHSRLSLMASLYYILHWTFKEVCRELSICVLVEPLLVCHNSIYYRPIS